MENTHGLMKCKKCGLMAVLVEENGNEYYFHFSHGYDENCRKIIPVEKAKEYLTTIKPSQWMNHRRMP